MISLRNYNSTGSKILEDRHSPVSLGEINVNPSMLLLDYISVWMTVFKKNSVRASTYDRLVTSRDALVSYGIANKPIGEITFFDIQDYVNELVESAYAKSSIEKQIRIVTAPLKKAAALRIIPADPSVGIEMPIQENIKTPTKEMCAYTDEEQESLLRTAYMDPKNAYLCAEFMIETGLRVGEALALRWKDVDINRRRFRVKATVVNLANKRISYVQEAPKSHCSNRTIPLTDRAVGILNTLKERARTVWVFENGAERLSYESLRYQTRKLCADANVEYHGEHVFRHTFATNCYYKGVDIKILSKLLGHADVTTTYNTYINLYGDGFEDLYRAIVK